LIERSGRSIDLAKKSYRPDFSLSAGLVNVGDRGGTAGIAQPPPDNGKNASCLWVGINIPIWRDKRRASGRSAEQLCQHPQRIEFSFRDQVIRLETLQEQVDLCENALIPQAEEGLRSAEAAYETAQLGVLDLLDSERVLLNLRLVSARY
jgi:outer membrane protein TolC